MRSAFLLVGLLVVGCSSMMPQADRPDTGSPNDTHMTGQGGAMDSGSCSLLYREPGCMGQDPGICDNGKGGACGGVVCDCEGKVHQTYCDRSDVPYSYRLDISFLGPDASLTCDPHNPDGGGVN